MAFRRAARRGSRGPAAHARGRARRAVLVDLHGRDAGARRARSARRSRASTPCTSWCGVTRTTSRSPPAPHEIRRAAAQGRIACLMGVEGGHIIEESLAALRTYHRLGVRYLTLTHSFHTELGRFVRHQRGAARRATEGSPPFGEEVVREMNRLGMLVDVSHVSDDTFWDVLRVTRAPVIASHSATRAVADHPRNLSDEMLRALAAQRRRGDDQLLLGLHRRLAGGAAASALPRTSRRASRSCASSTRTTRSRACAPRARCFAAWRSRASDLSVLLDHFDHALRVAGPDHVGIGADWDGVPSMPRGHGGREPPAGAHARAARARSLAGGGAQGARRESAARDGAGGGVASGDAR